MRLVVTSRLALAIAFVGFAVAGLLRLLGNQGLENAAGAFGFSALLAALIIALVQARNRKGAPPYGEEGGEIPREAMMTVVPRMAGHPTAESRVDVPQAGTHKAAAGARSVLILTPFYPPNVGGVETHLQDLVNLLIRLDREVLVVTYQPLMSQTKAPAFEEHEHCRVFRARPLGRMLYEKLENFRPLQFIYIVPILTVAGIVRARQYRNQIDVLHSQGLYAAIAGVLVSKILHLPHVVSMHTDHRMGKHAIIRLAADLAIAFVSRVLVPSRDILLDLPDHARSKALVYSYWIDQERFVSLDKAACRSKLGLDPTHRVVLYVGRLVESKGLDLLLGIARVLPDVAFVVIGSGHLQGQVEAAVRDLGNVRYLGARANESLPTLYGAADVVWGSADRDYIGRVSMEALSCGRPVVSPKQVSIFGAEIETSFPIEDFLTFLDTDPHIAASQLKEFLERARADAALERRCREFAMRRYSDANADAILESYRFALAA